jgi:hypothetical protein
MTAISSYALLWLLSLPSHASLERDGRRSMSIAVSDAQTSLLRSQTKTSHSTEGLALASDRDHHHVGPQDTHDHKDEEHEHRHEDRRIGPHKGVVEASDASGFRLHVAAQQNFGLATIDVKVVGAIRLPRSALLHSGPSTEIFRLRDGYWKAIPITSVRMHGREVSFSSPELRPGDAVAVQGIGFLKIVEQSIKAPIPEGHVH